MAIDYTLVVQTTPPVNKQPGILWLQKIPGMLSIYAGGDKYPTIAQGEPNLSITDGVYLLSVITTTGTTPPISPSVGQLWLDANYSYWVWLGKWCPMGGG